jgi:hypothetical protein
LQEVAIDAAGSGTEQRLGVGAHGGFEIACRTVNVTAHFAEARFELTRISHVQYCQRSIILLVVGQNPRQPETRDFDYARVLRFRDDSFEFADRSVGVTNQVVFSDQHARLVEVSTAGMLGLELAEQIVSDLPVIVIQRLSQLVIERGLRFDNTVLVSAVLIEPEQASQGQSRAAEQIPAVVVPPLLDLLDLFLF